MNVTALLLVLVAPLPFWLLGLPWCLIGDRRRMVLAPLVGCALAGQLAELAMMTGLPVRATLGAIVAVSAAAAVARGRDWWPGLREAAAEWVPLYCVAVVASSIAPFPGLGDWSGDWLMHYQMGEHVVAGNLPATLLARPPLFGAAAAPLWIFGPGLIPFQLMSAVAAASGVTVTIFFTQYFWPRLTGRALLPLLLSPFFLHHTAAAWPKLLAAGLILAAIVEARRDRALASGLLFALSVAAHEGSVIWAPCVIVAQAQAGRGWRGAWRSLLYLALTGALICGPLLAWIIAKYGLHAKVASNPALTEPEQVPFAIKTLLAVVTTFIGWGPLLSLHRWMTNPLRATGPVIAKEMFWLITSWFTTMAGTMLGVLFPFAVYWRRLWREPRLRRLLRPSLLVAAAITVLVNALLTGFYSNEGTMQAALIALALGAYGLLAGRLAIEPDSRRAFGIMSALMALFGAFPWVMMNLATSVGLRFSQAFRLRMQAGSEGDYFSVLDNHLAPLGMAAFPEVPLLALALLGASVWLTRQQALSPGKGPTRRV